MMYAKCKILYGYYNPVYGLDTEAYLEPNFKAFIKNS